MKFYCLAIFYFWTYLEGYNIQDKNVREYFLFDDCRIGLDFCMINGNRHFFYFEVSKQIGRKIFQEFLYSVGDLVLVDFVCFYEYIFNWFIFNFGVGCLNERYKPLSIVLRSSGGILHKNFYVNLGLNLKVYEEYSIKRYELSWFVKIRRKGIYRFRGFINGSTIFRSLFKSSYDFVFIDNTNNTENISINNSSVENNINNNQDFCGKNYNQNIFYSLYNNIKSWIVVDKKESKEFKDFSNDDFLVNVNDSQKNNDNVCLNRPKNETDLETVSSIKSKICSFSWFSRNNSPVIDNAEDICSKNKDEQGSLKNGNVNCNSRDLIGKKVDNSSEASSLDGLTIQDNDYSSLNYKNSSDFNFKNNDNNNMSFFELPPSINDIMEQGKFDEVGVSKNSSSHDLNSSNYVAVDFNDSNSVLNNKNNDDVNYHRQDFKEENKARLSFISHVEKEKKGGGWLDFYLEKIIGFFK